MTSILILAALALLSGRHLTIWIAWWPVASVPALGVVFALTLLAALAAAALVAVRWSTLGLGPVWRTA
jgi:hypothetical protein